jgi:hypothetical protein
MAPSFLLGHKPAKSMKATSEKNSKKRNPPDNSTGFGNETRKVAPSPSYKTWKLLHRKTPTLKREFGQGSQIRDS